MNGGENQLSSDDANQRPPKLDERRHGDWGDSPTLPEDHELWSNPWRITTALIAVFWIGWFIAYAVFALLNNAEMATRTMLPRSIAAVAGALVSFGMAWVVMGLRRRPLAVRAPAALALAVAGTIVHFGLSQLIWLGTVGLEDMSTSPLWVYFTTDFIIRFWWFAGISASILAVSYVADIREREERIVALQALAHDAQLRALRNQLNPHFLFNALNSIVGLLSRKRNGDATRMTENLADFLRATLRLDPETVVTLREEVELQQLYLDIEKVRFPDRLAVLVDIPDDLKDALVPSLITQPLVENSIKHAVARSTRNVQLRIAAARDGGDLILTVENEGGDGELEARKTGQGRLGLANVEQRLKAHYGDDAGFHAGPGDCGGFVNRIRLPLRTG
ncbi:MAG: sensor histidine kinase [Sphingomicrobium sp.]